MNGQTTKQPFPDFGPYLTYSEAVKSNTAHRLGIDNTPSQAEYDRMVQVYIHVYEPLCKRFGKIPVSSFFRCPKLNRAVGGSASSQHMRGEAIDLDCDSLKTPTNKALFAYVNANAEFDQIGLEYPDKQGNPGWVHISWVGREQNRKSTFTAS